eukprot:scaffold81453_cov79-Phaeocystis_antarctica.AAC.2
MITQVPRAKSTVTRDARRACPSAHAHTVRRAAPVGLWLSHAACRAPRRRGQKSLPISIFARVAILVALVELLDLHRAAGVAHKASGLRCQDPLEDDRREGRLRLGSEAVDEVEQLGLVVVVECRGVSSCRRPGPQELDQEVVMIGHARVTFIIQAEVVPQRVLHGLLLELGQLNDHVQHVADSGHVRLRPHERCRQLGRHVGKLIRLDEEPEGVLSVLSMLTAVQVEEGGGALEWSAGKASDDIADLLRTAGQLQQSCRSSRQANDRADLQ